MGGLIKVDQAIDEWNALIKREENAAYRVQTSSPLSPMEGKEEDRSSDMTIRRSCPSHVREDICEWCYQVVDHCDIDRDNVGTAMFYFDRYLSLHKRKSINENLIQLVAMTSLYLSVKLHGTKKISVSCMSSLSQGRFRVDQIEKMEICIIKTLHWYLNPPTPFMYLTIASPLIDDSKGASIEELSCYLIELSVGDEFFMDKNPSSVAYAAVLAAFDIQAIPRKSFLEHSLEYAQDTTELCIRRLRQVHSLAFPDAKEDSREGASPTTVFQELS